MQITITEILEELAPLEAGVLRTRRFWVNFTAERIVGSAIFFPYRSNDLSPSSGEKFYVEVDHSTITNFQRHGNDPLVSAISPLAERGNYQITGQVNLVIYEADGIQELAIEVIAQSISFLLDSSEINSEFPNVGEMVSFDLIELQLWDY